VKFRLSGEKKLSCQHESNVRHETCEQKGPCDKPFLDQEIILLWYYSSCLMARCD